MKNRTFFGLIKKQPAKTEEKENVGSLDVENQAEMIVENNDDIVQKAEENSQILDDSIKDIKTDENELDIATQSSTNENKADLIVAFRESILECEKLRTQLDEVKENSSFEKLCQNEEFVSKIIENENIKNKVIENYLHGIKTSGAVELLSGSTGKTPLTPPLKATTLKEAKILADLLIKGK